MYHSTLTKFALTAVCFLTLGILLQFVQTSYLGKDNQAIIAYPKLYSILSDITKIKINNKNQDFTLKKENDLWVVQELSDYPAKINKINTLLKELALMSLTEEIPFNSASFIKMRLLDNNAVAKIQLFEQQKEIVNLILGARKIGLTGVSQGTFVRKNDEENAFIADTMLDLTENSLSWVETLICNVPPSSIKNIETQYHVYSQAQLPSFLQDLRFYDVLALESYKDKIKPMNKATFTLNNKLKIIISLFSYQDKYYISITPELNSNVVTKEALDLFETISSINKSWLYRLPDAKLAILAPI